MRSLTFILLLVLISSFPVCGQMVTDMEDESKLYAQTKQVNQFFRRFNGEESERGDRYYPNDRQYRSTKLRKKYLAILFDESNKSISSDLKTQFSKEILDNAQTKVLDFHGAGWFAEAQTIFTMGGKDQPVTLFLALEKDHLGYKWVITRAFVPGFESYYKRDTTRIGSFLHPLSHELDFMNLRKAFITPDSVAQFASKKYKPDHLSVLLYEIRRGNMKFKTVGEAKFHFFQLDGWYFELSNFNRPGYNTGWLISSLVKVNNEQEKNEILKYLYHESP